MFELSESIIVCGIGLWGKEFLGLMRWHKTYSQRAHCGGKYHQMERPKIEGSHVFLQKASSKDCVQLSELLYVLAPHCLHY